MELAQGGIDLLDGESTTSKSALENTDIQTECVINGAMPDQMSLASLAQMNTPPKQLVFAKQIVLNIVHSSDFDF